MGITTVEKGIFKEPNSVFGKTFILVWIILFTTRLLTRTPLVTYYTFFEAFWYMFITAFTFVYALYIIFVEKKVDELHYYFVLIIFMPLIAGISAYLSLGFSIMSGIISQRHWFGISGVFLIVFLMKIKFYTLKDMFRAFEWCGWICLVWYILCYIFLDPKDYLDYNFVGYSDIKGGYRFKFGIDFIAFLTLYYVIKYMQERQGKMLFYGFIMIAYLFFLHQGRSVMLAIIGAIGLYYMFEVNFLKAIRFFVLAGIGFLILMGFLYLIIPNTVNDYVIQYLSLVQFAGGDVTADESVDARFEEMGIVLLFLLHYPIGWIIGLGKFASAESTAGGIHDVTTVPPGDIGIMGSVMTYGAIGTLLIYFQFLIPFRSLKFIKRFKKDTYLLSAKYFLFFCFLCSLAKGYLFMQPGSTAIFIVVIYAYKVIEVQMDKEGVPDTLILSGAH